MASVGVKVGGAWAALDQRQEQQKAVINELCCQLTSLQTAHEELSLERDRLQVKHSQLTQDHTRSLSDLHRSQRELVQLTGILETSTFLSKELEVTKQEEACSLKQTVQDVQDAATSREAAHQAQLHALEKQVVELREIIDSSMHTKRASTLKLETAMNALNLSKGGAKRFIEELQAVKGKVEQLTGERDRALLENVIVKQQRDCHADHAQLLVKENKRLLSQMQALRVQQAQTTAVQPSAEKQGCQKQHRSRQSETHTVSPSQDSDCKADDQGVSQRSAKAFDGNDVKNVSLKKPFDLSKGCLRKESVSSKVVLMQAQQIRAAGRTK